MRPTMMDPNAFGKVAVLMGGDSSERQVSLWSGEGVLKALQSEGIDAHAFDPAHRDPMLLRSEGFTRAFIALHGRNGEDGRIQALLEHMRIPYTGSGVAASALGMDKWRTKLVWQASGIPTPAYQVVDEQTDWMRLVAELGLPLIVKPAHEGSTIGITKVASVDSDELPMAYATAAQHDGLVIVEEFIIGAEYTAAILNGQVLPLVKIVAPQGNYDFEHKYLSDATQYVCPADLSVNEEAHIAAVVKHAFAVVGCRGWGRIDLMRRLNGEFFLLEVNTSPGMTGHSLVPMAARAAGLTYSALCVAILASASLDSTS
jgi:D-alanine-D-alanine ligase